MSVQIQLRRGNSSDWTTANPLLAQGEVGIELNTGLSKIGDGILSWNNLSYSSASYSLNGGTSGNSSSLSASYFSNGNTTINDDGFNTITTAVFSNGTNIDNNGNLSVFGSANLDNGAAYTDGNGNIIAVSVTALFNGNGSQITNIQSASYATTASYALNGGSGGGSVSSSWASSSLSASHLNSGQYLVTGIRSSLFGTASWTNNSVTASYITSSNIVGKITAFSSISASYALTASFSIVNFVTSSIDFQSSASWASSSLSASYCKTVNTTIDSNGITTTTTANFGNGTYIDNLGFINATNAGANFGPGGSTFIDSGGNLQVVGTSDFGDVVTSNISIVANGGGITGSLLGTASYAITSSYSNTASYALKGGSSTQTTVLSASWVSASAFITNAQTASYISSSKIVGIITSASYALSSSYSSGGSAVTYTSSLWGTASWAQTASVALNTSTPYAVSNATQSLFSTQSINAFSASWVSASVFVTTAQTASYIMSSNIKGNITAFSASWVSQSLSSSYSLTASFAMNGGGAGVIYGGSYNISASWASSSISASYAPGSSAATYTSSLWGTASWSATSSVALTASYVSTMIPVVVSASWASSSLSSSYI